MTAIERTIGTEEAATFLGVTRSRVNQLLREGVLNGERIGRDWRTTEQACEEYLRNVRPVKWCKR